MNDFEQLVIQNLKFSYSSVNSFITCPLSFKYSYIDVEDRINNFYSVFGSYVHLILEKYMKRELELWNLADYYFEHYQENMTCSPPAYPKGIGDKYYQQGLYFFENFEFDREEWEILGIEEKLSTKFKDIELVIVPDLILKNKNTGVITLIDYKTGSLYRDDKLDKHKLEDIKKQMNLYVYFVWFIKQIEITKIQIWAIRYGKKIDLDYDPVEGAETLFWFEDTIEKIKKETEWNGNNKNLFFCQNICSFYNLPCEQFK